MLSTPLRYPAMLAAPVLLAPAADATAVPRETLGQTVMTDFATERPVMVVPERHIDDALQDMIAAGIRALLVRDNNELIGMITASDILGTRPIRFLQSPLCEGQPCRHRDIRVIDCMTPWKDLQFLDYSSVANASVEVLAKEFLDTTASHLLVAEHQVGGRNRVRGLVSRTSLERKHGSKIPALVEFGAGLATGRFADSLLQTR